jgi:hypothetical protein
VRPGSTRLLLGVAALWALLHLAYLGQFIYHDSWEHNFPMLYGFARQGGCRGLPNWLWWPDSGTPTLIYAVSTSLTQILRVPALYALGCLHLDLLAGVYFYKAAIYLGYLALALGMYVLGRLALAHTLSAVYLFAATLLAGLCLDAAHSDQVVTITFWFPWILACGILYHRHYESAIASRYLNFAVLFLSLQAFDQYPHFALVAFGAAAAIYALLERERARAALSLHWRRLWPSALVLGLTIAHFLVFRAAVGGYAPSLRTALVVDPRLFSAGGFVQPSALIGSILPSTMLAGFDTLRRGTATLLTYFGGSPLADPFIFRLDELAFYVGIVPLLLSAVFFLRPGMARLRLGAALWLAVLLAVSLQQSRLYLLLFYYVPFFDIFRSYFLFVLFAVLGLLLTSAYGFDAVMSLPDQVLRLVLRRAGLALLVPVVAALVALLALLAFVPEPVKAFLPLEGPLARDLLLVAVAYPALVYAAWPRVAPQRRGLALLAVLALSQVVYTAAAYPEVAIAEPRLLARFGLAPEALRPLAAAVRDDPDAVQRKACETYAECYLAARPTASLRRDLDGTFLRARRDPVFAEHLDPPVVEALKGLTLPIFWTSRGVEEVDSAAALAELLDAHDADIAHYLRETVFVRKAGLARLAASAAAGTVWADHAELIGVGWGRDAVRLSYRADKPVLLNASITCTPDWRASVNGTEVPVICANFDGLVVPLPPGEGTLELSYRDRASDFVFATRYVLLALALFAIARVTTASLGRGPEDALF